MTSPLARLSRRVRAALAASAVAALATLTVLTVAPPEGDRYADARYVALGDSYAAGLGAGRNEDDPAGCRRSPNAYGPLWAHEHHVASFTFLACSGAVTTDLVERQLPHVDRSTTLVSLSIGGNDAGFVPALVACSVGDDQQCAGVTSVVTTRIVSAFPAVLDRTYAEVRSAAPDARVVVLGYPRLFEEGPCPGAMGEFKRAALDGVGSVLDRTIREAADRAGFTFVDVAAAWAGHGVCGADPWINPLTIPVAESMHPTGVGQRRLLDLLDAATRPAATGPVA